MSLDKNVIKLLDPQIVDIVVKLNQLPFCSTIHSCSGHPDSDKAATPYIDIHYNSKEVKQANSFHLILLKTVPYIDFRILPPEYRGKEFEEIISKSNHFFHYYMDTKHLKNNITKFWRGWEKALNYYNSNPTNSNETL